MVTISDPGRTFSSVTFGEAAAALAALAVTALVIWKWTRKGEKVPPGSLARSSFLGGADSFLSAYYHNETRAWYEKKVKKYGPIFKASVMGRTTVFMDAPEGNKIVFNSGSDEKLLKGFWPPSIAPMFGRHALAAKTGKAYEVHRSHLLNNFLGAESVHKYASVMNQKAVRIIKEHWMSKEDNSVVHAFKLLHVFSFEVIAQLCIGLTDPVVLETMRDDFFTFGKGMYMTPIKLPGFGFYESWLARQRIIKFLAGHVARRREDLKEGRATADQDLLSILLTRPDIDGHFFDDEEIHDRIIQVVYAGFDTSPSTLSTVLKNIGQRPEVYEELVKEHISIAATKAEGESLNMADIMSMKYSWRVVEESLRLTPGLLAVFREANTDFKYKGFTIHKGDVVAATSMNSSWNEDLFENWQKFDPSRFEHKVYGDGSHFKYFPFGGGHRLCPGKQFARMTMMIFLHHLVRNIKWTPTMPDEKVVYSSLPVYTQGLPLKITKLNPPLW
ncbi:protein MpCYP716-like23 [Marchantia polymorpha subsp. ruderalis]|uniref:Cytochrome P450 n=2 Tax=Marchantia polymorpha TaxID=3197 RepID=A0A176VQV0_MARPO|nr:hypothetical protein AXG93_745s1100 [Marchantia polymorpha subsp. ruderalis]PTQ36143.1 hypothetical protein MARPO_0066s0096 [Marchantia polymorpha]BBN07041.1 hypothetical protein Mp_4g00450 [Marchantia polymorpha subsp. ruderalis]|eukprot:PTQ36143.1 hypothetical protein MARPO_0066s0096 [Marchantia polymorpha]